MPEHTSIYELRKKLSEAKERLALAKKDKLKGAELQPFTKAVKNCEAALKAAERAIKDSKKS